MLKTAQDIEQNSSDSEEILNNDKNMECEQNEQSSEDDEPTAGPSGVDGKPLKKKKRGIIYISSIPKFMNVTILREMLSEYAKIGRIFLQPGKLTRKYFVV